MRRGRGFDSAFESWVRRECIETFLDLAGLELTLHPVEKGGHRTRVVTRAYQALQTQVVCLAFVAAREPCHGRIRGELAEHRIEADGRCDAGAQDQRGTSEHLAALGRLQGVLFGDVRDLVAEQRRQFGLVADAQQRPGVHVNRARRQREGVHFLVPDGPDVQRSWRHFREHAVRHRLQVSVESRVTVEQPLMRNRCFDALRFKLEPLALFLFVEGRRTQRQQGGERDRRRSQEPSAGHDGLRGGSHGQVFTASLRALESWDKAPSRS